MVRLVSGLATVALLGAAMWLTNYKPQVENRMMKPISSNGRIGQVVGNSVFSIRVRKADVASGIVEHDVLSGDRAMRSLGVFVIVYAQMRSNREPFDPGHVRLATSGGRFYEESGRSKILTKTPTFQPMTWGSVTYVFEIPKSRLAGSRLIVGQSKLIDDLSAQTDVDLGIDDAAAARLLAHPPSNYPMPS